MASGSFFSNIVARDNYDEVMEYLAVAETQHAPRFEFDNAPEQLRELIEVAETPRGPERSQWLNDYAEKSWAVPDGEAEVLLAKEHLNAIRPPGSKGPACWPASRADRFPGSRR